MAVYNAPGVYVQDQLSGTQTVSQVSSSVGAMIGVTRSGVINVPQKIGSWTEFISKYANGLSTPFAENMYLPYAVHGFFTNGGSELYIGSVKGTGATKASVTTAKNKLSITAQNEGVWGNDLKVSLKKIEDYAEGTNEVFVCTISLGTSDSTAFEVTKETFVTDVKENSKASNWIGDVSFVSVPDKLAEEEATLSGGTDGEALTDASYTEALKMLDSLEDVTLVAIPGQTSKVVNDAIISYCDNNGLFPIIDMPIATTTEQAKAYRKGLNAFTGALVHPWGKMNDPLTNTLKAVPSCGHVMGVYARIITNRGVHKAPAGIEATVRGFVEMEYQVTTNQISTLNSVGVICITSRPNAGIVLWGARSLNSTDSTMRYISDGLLNLTIKKSLYNGTQFAVFEPNDESLWSRVETACKAFLEGLRLEGALKGDKDEAYYVTVNSTNNTANSIAEGQLNIEVGYAPVKPAEFVIIKLAHSIES